MICFSRMTLTHINRCTYTKSHTCFCTQFGVLLRRRMVWSILPGTAAYLISTFSPSFTLVTAYLTACLSLSHAHPHAYNSTVRVQLAEHGSTNSQALIPCTGSYTRFQPSSAQRHTSPHACNVATVTSAAIAATVMLPGVYANATRSLKARRATA